MRRSSTLVLVLLIFALAGCGESPGDNAAQTSAPGAASGSGDIVVAKAEGTTAESGLPVIRKGAPAPRIKAVDIRGIDVDLDDIIAKNPDLIIEFFFNVNSGKEIALKLKILDKGYRDSIEVIALGLNEDEGALRKFASELSINYYIIDTDKMEDADWLEEIRSLPLTLFVHPADEPTIVKVIKGSGTRKADLIKQVAQNFFRQQKLAKAQTAVEDARKAGEDERAVSELSGYILTAQGKLDEAEKEFGAIESNEGLAKVAFLRGDYNRVLDLTAEAGSNSGYADTLKAAALQRQGKIEEANRAYESAVGKPAEDWQTSEAWNGRGRILHRQGATNEAIDMYRKAIDFSLYNVTALSNEGAAHRELGDLDAAEAVLKNAEKLTGGSDELAALMLKQVLEEKAKANDLKRQEFIRRQIADLGARYKELKSKGLAEPEDPWSTRPQILAFLPSPSVQTAFFERAGTDVVVRREIESRLGNDDRITMVEREVLDKLLQELNLGSSELADKNTRLQLGKVLAARMLGIIDFVSMGKDNVMYVRLTDTQTSRLVSLAPKAINFDTDIGETIQTVVDEILKRIVDDQQLQGLIADAPSDDSIMINIGAKHGVREGQQFIVIKEGDAIKAGGRIIAHRTIKVATIEVIDRQPEYSLCKVVSKSDGVKIKPEMKIKEAKTSG